MNKDLEERDADPDDHSEFMTAKDWEEELKETKTEILDDLNEFTHQEVKQVILAEIAKNSNQLLKKILEEILIDVK